MALRQYVLTFTVIAAVTLIIGLIAADQLSGSVVAGALCVGAGGTVGVSYRRHRRAKNM